MAPRPVDVTIRGKDDTKAAFDSAEAKAKGFSGRLSEMFKAPLNIANVLAATVAGFLSSAIVQFGRASVESAAQASAAWGRVESAVTNVGMKWDVAKGSLDKLFTSIQRTTRYSDDDAASAFATLVRMSNDYTGSIKNLNLAADIAAAKQIDLVSASEILGKVMAGETGHLKKLGVVIHEGEDAMVALRRQFNGFAERDAQTLQGRLSQIANAWDNVKEAIGRALTSVDASGHSYNALAVQLDRLGQWIDDNKVDLQSTAHLLGDVFSWLLKISTIAIPLVLDRLNPLRELKRVNDWLIGVDANSRGLGGPKSTTVEFQSVQQWSSSTFADQNAQEARDRIARTLNQKKANDEKAKAEAEAEAKHIANLKHEYELMASLGKLTKLTTQERERQYQIEVQLEAIAKDRSQTMENRAGAADFTVARQVEQRKQLADILNKLGPGDFGFARARLKIPVKVKGIGMPLPTEEGGSPGFMGAVRTSFEGAAGVTEPLETALGSLEGHLQGLTGGALAGFFKAWQEGIGDVIHAHNVLGTVVPQIMRKAVGSALAADAQDTLLRAAKALALALTDPSGIHALQAGKLFAVGSAELAAAAALSGGGGRGFGGGGGISAGGFTSSQNDMGSKGKVTIVLKGKGINFQNRDDLDALVAAIKELDSNRELEFIVDGGVAA